LPEHDHHTWTQTAWPLFALLGTAFSNAGLLWALQVMGSKMSNKTFWTSREKWTTIRFFEAHGYAVTKKGWRSCDVYQLASAGNTLEGDEDKGLFAKIYPIHLKFICRQKLATSQKEKLQQIELYERELNETRIAHYNLILGDENESGMQSLLDEELVMKIEPKKEIQSYWNDVAENPCKRKFQLALVVTLILSFWAMLAGLGFGVAPEVAVEKGIEALKDVSYLTWFGFAWFTVVYNAYFYAEWRASLQSTVSGVVYLFKCCPIQGEWETEFKTPKWHTHEEVEARTLKTLVDEFGTDDDGTPREIELIDPVENKENWNIIKDYVTEKNKPIEGDRKIPASAEP